MTCLMLLCLNSKNDSFVLSVRVRSFKVLYKVKVKWALPHFTNLKILYLMYIAYSRDVYVIFERG